MSEISEKCDVACKECRKWAKARKNEDFAGTIQKEISTLAEETSD